MAHLSDFDLRQMDDDWQDKQPDVVIRSLLKRTLDDLRVARDRLNQNPNNSSRPSGSMPPWQSSSDTSKGDNDDPDDILLSGSVDSDSTDNNNNSDTPEHPKGDAPQSNTDAVAQTSLPPEAQSKPTHVIDVPKKKNPGRPIGAPGYGRTQKLEPTDHEYHHPERCAGCQRLFLEQDHAGATAWTGWYTLEICRLSANPGELGWRVEVTLHVLMQCTCECGHVTQATALRSIKDSMWEGAMISEQRLLGPRLAAVVVYLSLRMRLPRYKVQELLFELFGLEISTALIDQTIKQTARSVEPMQDELVTQIEQAALAHADESSWSEGPNHLWLWVLYTRFTVLYWIDKRTKEVFDNVLSLDFMGILMTDGYQTYRCRPNRLRCWAHLLRKLCGVAESTDRSAAQHGEAMLGLFKDLMQAVFDAKEHLKAAPLGQKADPDKLPMVTHAKQVLELKTRCEQNEDAKHEHLRGIARELLNDWDVIMRVLAEPWQPLTNNAAERQLRHWVIARRISYGTRNRVGSNSLALLASVIDTCRLRNANVIDLLAQAIDAARHGRPAPALPAIPAHLLGQDGAQIAA